jgi:hypothetical protein
VAAIGFDPTTGEKVNSFAKLVFRVIKIAKRQSQNTAPLLDLFESLCSFLYEIFTSLPKENAKNN